MSRPDAVRWPRTGCGLVPDASENIDTITDFADRHLQCGPLELAYWHPQPGEYFATKDPRDTLLYPFGHPQEGQSRYRWEQQPDGVSYGYLIDGA